jgi:O-antigen/teichoic acid export membrane protein
MNSEESNAEDLSQDPSLKLKTARTLKWNVIDKVASQVLYAVTGIVLARVLSQADFGLVGAVLIFQAFALLLIDSGFSFALIQRKSPSELDYSSVFWMNMAIAVILYVILYAAAPLIAMCFENDQRLIPLSRVMFLTLILNASAIVQTNRFMKRMNVRPVAMSNAIALIVGAVVGITMALTGFGAWAIVWQAVAVAGVKSLILWVISRWTPMMKMSFTSLKSFVAVGSGMMMTSFLNTLFQNLYSFFIGNRVGLVSLGYYTQGDKWSKMPIASLSQVLTSSFLPVLSGVQDDATRFQRMVGKMNRLSAYLLFPAMIGLIVTATPIFHFLFGTKWDASIILFQLLLVRGIFTVVTSLYTNYLLALGRSKLILSMEIVRDSVALVALAVTFPYLSLTTPDDPVLGVTILLWGQLIASVVAWAVTLIVTAKVSGYKMVSFVTDLVPYLVQTAVIAVIMYLVGEEVLTLTAAMSSTASALMILIVEAIVGLGLYLAVNHLLKSQIQRDAISYLRGRL